MKFVNPWILSAVPAVLLAGFAVMAAAERRKKRALKLITGGNAVATLSLTRRWIRYSLIMAALTLLLAAAARPYVRTVTLAAPDNARDVLVLFDVSKSMRATDLPPSRMKQAKYLLREIFGEFRQDRFGIIPFAGRAFLSCPLTSDHHALLIAVDDLDTSSVPVGGTNLNAALQTAQRAFAGSQGDHRAIILLTDGDQLSGNALDAAKELKENGIPVVAVGFGSPDAAAPIPGDKGGLIHSASGEVAGSRLDETLLQKIAAETGGIYLRSTVNDTGFETIRRFLGNMNKASVEKKTNSNPDDLFGYFIAAAAILLFAAGSLSEYRRLVLLVLFCGTLPLAAEEIEKKAADPVKMYQQAVELQRAKDAGAENIYGELIAGKDTPGLIRGRALHNLAVIDHLQARETMVKSHTALRSQNPDEALKEVEQAVKELNSGKELYSRAMEFRENEGTVSIRTDNYQQLILDLKEAEKLKKQIEELKKQQQNAQNKTKQAQQQNQQQQQQQQQQNQQQQQQQQQNQQQQQQQQQNQQQQQQQQQSAASKAAKEAEKLENQARDLGQQKMADDARQAAEKLQEADKLQQQGKPREAQKKLDEAAEKLGADQDKKSDGGDKDESGKAEKKAPENKTPDSGESEKKAENKPKSDAERKLDLLDDEAKELRDAIRRQRNLRRRPVEKDW